MVNHDNPTMSESEEMYLITIARLVEQGEEEPVPISRLSGELSIQSVSANQMVHKLAEEEFVEYFPYKGVQLTPKGKEVAQQVLRDRRLWEVFLVNHLELPPSEADALACRLEHITPKGVTCQLAKFLGHPSFTPQGLPIPKVSGSGDTHRIQPLSELGVGELGEIIRLEGDPATQAFLEAEGFRPGIEVIPLAKGQDGAFLLQVGQDQLHISQVVADSILIAIPIDRRQH